LNNLTSAPSSREEEKEEFFSGKGKHYSPVLIGEELEDRFLGAVYEFKNLIITDTKGLLSLINNYRH
jgi:hypothetical protein